MNKFKSLVLRHTSQIISVLLAGCLIISLTPLSSLAVGSTQYPQQDILAEQRSLLSRLIETYGADITEEEMVQGLIDLDIFSEEGDVIVTGSIKVDGAEMSLNEVKELLSSGSSNPEAEVDIDGIVITLGELEKLLAIEDTIAALEEQYFSDSVEITDEHLLARESLIAQLSNGNSFDFMPLATENKLQLSHITRGTFATHDQVEVQVSMTLVAPGDVGVGTAEVPISAEYRVLDGSASIEYGHYQMKPLGGVENETTGTLTIPAGESYSNTVYILLNKPDGGADKNLTNSESRWTGSRTFFVQLYNPKGALMLVLDESDQLPHGHYHDLATTHPISISQEYNWPSKTKKELEETDTLFYNKFVPDYYYYYNLRVLEQDETLLLGTEDADNIPKEGTFFHDWRAEDIEAINRITKPLIADGIAPHPSDSQSTTGEGFTVYDQLIMYFSDTDDRTKDWHNELIHMGLSDSSSTEIVAPGAALEMHLLEVSFLESQKPYYFHYAQSYAPFALDYTKLPTRGVYQKKFDRTLFESNINLGWSQSHGKAIAIDHVDSYKPTVLAATAPSLGESASYNTGQLVPITVEFSEPVIIPESATLVPGDGQQPITLPFVEVGSTSKKASCYYAVPEGSVGNIDSMTLQVSPDLIVDMANNYGESIKACSTTISFNMDIDKRGSFDELTVSGSSYGSNLFASTDIITATLTMKDGMYDWVKDGANITSEPSPTGTTYRSNLVTLDINGEAYPLYLGGEGEAQGSYLEAHIPADSLASIDGDVTKTVSVFLEEGGKTGEEVLSINPTTITIEKKLVNVKEAWVVADNTKGYELYIDDGPSGLTLWTDPEVHNAVVTWESSDDTILEIAQDVQNPNKATVTPKTPGEVTITAKVTNHDSPEPIEFTAKYLIYQNGEDLRLSVDQNLLYLSGVVRYPLPLLWQENITQTHHDAGFQIDLYEGYYATISECVGDPIYTTTTDDNTKNYTILPEYHLTKASSGNVPSYTAKVSAINMGNEAVAPILIYVSLRERPATISISRPQAEALTDNTASYTVTWDARDLIQGEVSIEVTKNGLPFSSFYADDTSESTGTLDINLDKVPDNALKDTYEITAKVRNHNDPEAYLSTDSYTLDVYRHSSLKVHVNNTDTELFTLENPLTTSQLPAFAEILAMSLQADLEINHADFGKDLWAVNDRITWESSDSSTASINAKRGLQHKDIESLALTTYSPYETMMLAGQKDGTTTITATHRATGMTDSVEVDVKTLKDKLYLFNTNFGDFVNVSYTNGDGIAKQVKTDSNGTLVIYEESGIASGVTFMSKTSGITYVGFVPQQNLVSGQGKAENYETYRVNHVTMQEASKVTLSVKTPDGEPYTGNITYRSAAYKNDVLCEDSINKAGITLDGRWDGLYSITFDEDTLWTGAPGEGIVLGDSLEFMLEIIVEDDSYRPVLTSKTTKIMANTSKHFGETIVTLVEKPQGSAQGKPFILKQAIDYGTSNNYKIDITRDTANVGPSTQYPNPSIDTYISWLGVANPPDSVTATLNANNKPLSTATITTLDLPFTDNVYSMGSTPITENSLLAAGINMGDRAPSSLRLEWGPGGITLPCTFNITNAVGLSKPEGDAAFEQDVQNLIDTNSQGMQTQMTDENENVTPDGFINMTLKMVDGIHLGTPYFNLTVKATEDPYVFRGIGHMGAGLGENAGANPYELEIGDVEMELNYAPSITDIAGIEPIKDAITGAHGFEAEVGAQLVGCYEVEIRYDFDRGSWCLALLGGGADLSANGSLTANGNMSMFLIPITFSFGVGVDFETGFRAVQPKSVPEGSSKNALVANDILTKLRLSGYVQMFGGFGFDYSVAALKLGVIGRADLGLEYRFLNRPYLPDNYRDPGYIGKVDSLYDMNVYVDGYVGIHGKMKLLFVSLEATWKTYEFNKSLYSEGTPELIDSWLAKNDLNILGTTEDGTIIAEGMEDSSIGFESREYLASSNAESGEMGALGTSTFGSEIGSYPYARPQVTRDGQLMVYLSDNASTDLNETRANWAKLEGGSYVVYDAIDKLEGENIRGDSGAVIDGTESGAVAAWVRQAKKIDGEFSSAAAQDMLNSSEVYASVYDGTTATWQTTRLTENTSADMAPVVAFAGGNAIVAWRTPIGTGYDASKGSFDYDSLGDAIVYRTYNATDGWSEQQILYMTSGNTGRIKSLNASMLEDGTAAIAYTVDATGAEDYSGYEVELGIINGVNGTAKVSCLSSLQPGIDQNAQIRNITIGGVERFLVGWHHLAQETGSREIQLRVVNTNGSLYGGFTESASQQGASYDFVSTCFGFSRSVASSPEDISLVYVTRVEEANSSSSILAGIDFFADGSGYSHTSPYKITQLGNNVSVDSLDSYRIGDTVKTISQSTAYLDGETPISTIQEDQGRLENEINAELGTVNPDDIKPGNNLKIPLTITNKGGSAIENLEVSGIGAGFSSKVNLKPNQKDVITLSYIIPSDIADVEYTIKATFANGETREVAGTLKLAALDLSVGALSLVKESDMQRSIKAILYNRSVIPVDPATTKVKVGLYKDSTFDDSALVDEVELTADEITLLNDGSLTKHLNYNVEGGIPEAGINLFVRIAAYDAKANEVEEFYTANNQNSLSLNNLLVLNGMNPYRVNVIDNSDDGVSTTAQLSIMNLTAQSNTTGGILTAWLHDENDNIIEEKKLAVSDSFSPEGTVLKDIAFDTVGYRVSGIFTETDYNPNDPVISADLPGSTEVYETDPVTLSISAGLGVGASGPLTYQWYKDGIALSGQTLATLSITSASPFDSGAYHVVISNGQHSVQSVVCALSVNEPPAPDKPVITTDLPNTATVDKGTTHNLSITAAPVNGTLSYQWYKNGVAIPGATWASYQIPSAQVGDAGAYHVIVTNTYYGNVSSTQSATCDIVIRDGEALYYGDGTTQGVKATTTQGSTTGASQTGTGNGYLGKTGDIAHAAMPLVTLTFSLIVLAVSSFIIWKRRRNR